MMKSNSINSSFVSDRFHPLTNVPNYNRSPSQKINFMTLNQEFNKEQNINKKDSLTNLLQKKRNSAQYTPKKLKLTQSMKIFNDLIKPNDSRISQPENEKEKSILNDTIKSQIENKITVKSTKQQITEFHDSILQELDRVRLQQEQKHNLSQSARRSTQQLKITKQPNYQISKSQYYTISLQLRQAKEQNQKLKNELNKVQKQILIIKSNYEFNQENNESKIRQRQNSRQYNDQQKSIQFYKQKNKLDTSRKNKNQQQQIILLKQKIEEYIKQRNKLEILKYQLQNDYQKLQETLNKTNQQLKIKQKKIKFIEQEKQLMNQEIQLNGLKINSLQKENKQKSKIILDIKSKNQILNNEIQTLHEKIMHQDQHIHKITREIDNLSRSLEQYKQINQQHINFNNQLEQMIKKNSQKEQQLRNNLLMFQNEILKLNQLLNQKEKIIEYLQKPKTSWGSSYHNEDQNKEFYSNSSFENSKNIYSIEEKQENQQQSHFDEEQDETNNNPSDQQIIKNKEKLKQLQEKNTQYKITINQLTIFKNKNQIQLTQQKAKTKQFTLQIEKLKSAIHQYPYKIQQLEKQIEKCHQIQQELQRRNQEIMIYNEQLRQQQLKLQQTLILKDCSKKTFNLFDDVKIFAKQENQKIEIILNQTINLLKNHQVKIYNRQHIEIQDNQKIFQIPSQKILKIKQIIQIQIHQIFLQVQKAKLKYLNSFISVPQKKIIIENLRCIESKLQKSQQILLKTLIY